MMDVTDTFVFIFSIVDGMALLFLTVYFVSLIVYQAQLIIPMWCALRTSQFGCKTIHRNPGRVKSWSAPVRPIHRTHGCEPNVIQRFCTRGCTPTKKKQPFWFDCTHCATPRFIFIFICDQ